MYNYCHVSIIIDLMEISYPRSSGLPIVKIRSSRGRADRARPRVINTTRVSRVGGLNRWTMISHEGARRNYKEARIGKRSDGGARALLFVQCASCVFPFVPRPRGVICAARSRNLARNDLWAMDRR